MLRYVTILWFFLLFVSENGVWGQSLCNNRFSSLLYRGISYDSFTCITTTRANEIVAGAAVYKDQSLVAKFSAKGTVLFSFQYYPVYENNLTFYSEIKYTQVAQTKDGGFILAANGLQRKWVNTGNGPNPIEIGSNVGMLVKIDAFGNPVWCQRFESANSFRYGGFSLSITNVLEIANGDFVVYLASDYGRNYPNYSRIVCLSSTGSVKWNTLLAAGYYGGLTSLDAKRGLLQAKNGNLVIADIAYQTNRESQPEKTTAASIHFLSLDAASGAIRWETNYDYPYTSSINTSEIVGLSELSNGNFVCFASFAKLAAQPAKALRIVTSNTGIFQSASLYQTAANSGTQVVTIAPFSNDRQTALFKTPQQSILAQLNGEGGIEWQKGLNDFGGLFPANCHTSTSSGFAIFASNYNSRDTRLFLTDNTGGIDCVNEETSLRTEPFTLTEGPKIVTVPNTPDQNKFGTATFAMRADPYPFVKTVDCEAAPDCCFDVVDSVSRPAISICEGRTFLLPDNTPVTKTGTYYVIYKTPKGCDSVVYYKITIQKDPSALSLGADLCLEGKDSVVLTATEGYNLYTWMNGTPTDAFVYTARRPGDYWVQVSNICGSKTDTLKIYDHCTFPVYVPSAFSPNGDGKNDVFRVPPANKNNFISLKIFNRWGQLVFSTNEEGKGWNGMVRGMPQETGVYVYFVEMQGLSGQRVSQKGTVLLVR